VSEEELKQESGGESSDHDVLPEMDYGEQDGFRKNSDPGAENDSYFPVKKKAIEEMLMPLSVLLKKACYVHPRSRCAAVLIAKGLLRPMRPRALILRYFVKIQSYKEWVDKLEPLEYKFESHMDGVGVRKMLRT
jgi:hypothetical protein